MATELWKLRQQVEELLNSKSEFGSEPSDGTAGVPKAPALEGEKADGPGAVGRHIGR